MQRKNNGGRGQPNVGGIGKSVGFPGPAKGKCLPRPFIKGKGHQETKTLEQLAAGKCKKKHKTRSDQRLHRKGDRLEQCHPGRTLKYDRRPAFCAGSKLRGAQTHGYKGNVEKMVGKRLDQLTVESESVRIDVPKSDKPTDRDRNLLFTP
jgi:hypothetical protein